jgi:formamidopyrimidine-DNA glycosylase
VKPRAPAASSRKTAGSGKTVAAGAAAVRIAKAPKVQISSHAAKPSPGRPAAAGKATVADVPASPSAEPPPRPEITGLQRLGPEPFDAVFDASYLRNKLKKSQRTIKTALLDQALVAGVGNIYADESLFAAGIRPQTPCSRLSKAQLQRLQAALVEVLQQSIGAGGTTFSDFRDLSGTNGNYGGMAWVYRRGGQPCRRCGNTINRTVLGGRSSHWCPSCQH